MAKDISVAPKERVNIKYVSDTGGAKKSVELPLRMAILGDFTGRGDETPFEERKPIEVNKENFDDVLSAHNLKLDLAVKDKLSGREGGELSVSVPVSSMKDFKPESIANNVPELRKLLELRTALKSQKALFNKAAFKKKLEAIVKDDAQRSKLLDELGVGGEDAGA